MLELDQEISTRNRKKTPQKNLHSQLRNLLNSRQRKIVRLQERQSWDPRQPHIRLQKALQEDPEDYRTQWNNGSVWQHLRVHFLALQLTHQTDGDQQGLCCCLLRGEERFLGNSYGQPLGPRVLLWDEDEDWFDAVPLILGSSSDNQYKRTLLSKHSVFNHEK